MGHRNLSLYPPNASCLTNLINDGCCIFYVVIGSEYQQVIPGDIVALLIDRHLMRGGPSTIGIIGIAHIVSRREMLLSVVSHQERDILGVVVLIANHDIEDHPTKHLLGFRVGQS